MSTTQTSAATFADAPQSRPVSLTALFMVTLLVASAFGAFAPKLQAQTGTLMPLPAFERTYSSTRGMWFQAPTDFRIVGVRMPVDGGSSGPQSMQIVRFSGQTTPPNGSSYTTLLHYANVNDRGVQAADIVVNQGDVIAAFGCINTGEVLYNNGTVYTSSILGQSTSLYRLTAPNVHTGQTSAPLGVSTSGTIGRVEIYYTPLGPELDVSANTSTRAMIYADAQGSGGNGVQLGSFNVTNGAQPNGEMDAVEIEATGTADASSALSELKLYRDDNSNGQFDFGTDVEIGTFPSFTTANGTSSVSLSSPEADFSANESNDYFLVGKLSGTAAPGETLDFKVSDLTLGGQTTMSGVPTSDMEGAEIQAPDLTIADVSLQNQIQAPIGTSNNLLQAFTLDYPNGPDNMISEIEIEADGTGDDSSAYSELSLFLDDGDGSFDAGVDTLISTSSFGADNGSAVFTIQTGSTAITSGTSPRYYIAGSFNLSGNHSETFSTRVVDVRGTLTGTNLVGAPAPSTGTSPGIELLGEVILIDEFGPSSPMTIDNDAEGASGEGVLMLDFSLVATNADWSVSSLVIEASGSGDDSTAFSELALYEDADRDGVFQGTGFDTLAAPLGTAFMSDDGTWTATLNAGTITSATSRRFFVTAKFAGTAISADTFAFRLAAINATPPSGGSLVGLPGALASNREIGAAEFNVGFNGPQSATTINSDAAAAVLLDFDLEVRNAAVNVTSITFAASGSGHDANAFSELALYEDADDDGQFNFALDTLAAPTVSGFDADDGSYTATLTDPVANGPALRRFFLVATFNGTAGTGDTFNARVDSLTSTSNPVMSATGLPTSSSLGFVIDQAVLTLGLAATSPAALVVEKTGSAFTQALATYQATASNSTITLNSLRFTPGGTGDWVNDLDPAIGVQIYLDNGDNLLDTASDTLAYESGGSSSAFTVDFTSLSIANSESVVFFAQLNFSASAGGPTPSTYTLGINATADVSLAGAAMVLLGVPAPTSNTLTLIDYFVSAFSPSRVNPATSGQPITITGSGFTSPVSLRIDGVLAGGAGVVDPDGTRITGFTVPEHEGTGLEIELSTGLLGTRTLSFTFNYAEEESGDDSALCSLNGNGAGLPAWLWLSALSLLLASWGMRRRVE